MKRNKNSNPSGFYLCRFSTGYRIRKIKIRLTDHGRDHLSCLPLEGSQAATPVHLEHTSTWTSKRQFNSKLYICFNLFTRFVHKTAERRTENTPRLKTVICTHDHIKVIESRLKVNTKIPFYNRPQNIVCSCV